jgi:hypothetical protein
VGFSSCVSADEGAVFDFEQAVIARTKQNANVVKKGRIESSFSIDSNRANSAECLALNGIPQGKVNSGARTPRLQKDYIFVIPTLGSEKIHIQPGPRFRTPRGSRVVSEVPRTFFRPHASSLTKKNHA